MASVRKRSGSWQVRWRLPNGQDKAETARGWTKQEALEYGRAQEAAARRTPWVTTAPAETPFLNDYGPDVLSARSITEKRKKDDLAAWSNRIRPHFDGLRIAGVAPADVRSMVTSLNERGYAASTVRDTYRLVAYVFSTAQADGLVAATPCVRVSLPRRHIEDEVKPADPKAVSAIAEVIDPRYRPLVLFLAATGVRIGEALAVRRIDLIDMPRPAVRISKTLHDDGSLGLTKTRRARVITLADWYARILSEHLKVGTSEMVFPSPRGMPLPPRRFSSRYWRPATLLAGHPGVTPHQVRHLHVTQLFEEGRPLTEVSSRLGHSNPRVTAEIYAAWIRDDDSGAADATPDFTEPTRFASGNH